MGRGAAASETAKAAFWFVLFMFASVSMVIFNKLIMTSFPYANALLMIQNMMTIGLNCLGTQIGIFEMKPWQLDHFKIWALPTATFSIMLLTSLYALPLVAVATTVVFRNIGTVLVAAGDALIFKKEFNQEMKTAIAVIVFGSVVYGYYDLDYNAVGYVWMTANTCIFACNVLYEKYAVISVDQTAVGVSCYQNILSIPLLGVALLSSGETVATGAYQELSFFMQSSIIATGFFGCLLSICYMSLNKFVSPTSITIASNLNKLVSAIVGAVVFHSTVSAHAIVGLLICMMGGYLYSSAPKPSKVEAPAPSDEEVALKPSEIEIDQDDGDDKQN